MILLSIIIPFYNRADLMTRMLDSLAPIRDDRVEIIFVDNNSNTQTREKIALFIKTQLLNGNPTILSLIDQQKKGAPAARNKGLSVAKGEYVCFFDSDDTFSPDVLDDFFDVIKTEQVDIIALHTYMVENRIVRRKNNSLDMDAAVHLVANRFATQSFILNRQFALEKATWNEALYYWNDLEWAFRILLSFSSFKWLKGCYHYIYHHSQSITGTSFSSHLSEIIIAHDEIENDINIYCDNKKEVGRLKKALALRKSLYAGYIKKEGDFIGAKRVFDTVMPGKKEGVIFNLLTKSVFLLAGAGVKGVWRLAAAYLTLFYK